MPPAYKNEMMRDVKGRIQMTLRMYGLTSVSPVLGSTANSCWLSLFLDFRAMLYPDLARRRLVCRGGFKNEAGGCTV